MKTEKRYSITALALAALAAIALPLQKSAAEENDKPEWKGSIETGEHMTVDDMAKLAKTPLDQALNTAMGEVAGKAIKAELESEDGYLIYGVEIVTAEGKVKEVILDPANGKVLSVENEESHQKGDQEKEEGES